VGRKKPTADEIALRDWFAGLAMASLLGTKGGFDECVATSAYEMADAMLKARENDGI